MTLESNKCYQNGSSQPSMNSTIEHAQLQILDIIGHELRTPLHAIMGMSGLLLRTDLHTQQKEYIQDIVQNSHTLFQTIDALILYSKLFSNQIPIQPQPFNLTACIYQIYTSYLSAAVEKNIKLHYHIDPLIPEAIVGDLSKIQKILQNLLENALKYTTLGEIEISAVLLDNQVDSIVIQFSVRDTGIGIPLSHIPLLFESFTQGDSTYSRQYGGMGLGLAVTAKYVEIMDGSIWVDSIPDQGSTFYFKIPVSDWQIE